MNIVFIWTEKYRPKTISECILPSKLQKYFDIVVKEGQIQNMIFSGGPGVGKTTVAKALCNQLECDYIVINASEENGIDVLRTKIKHYASTVSFNGKPKVVIMDEADYLNPNSVQPALRAFLEEFSSNCRFIFTCNIPNRIIAPLKSRMPIIDFDIPKDERVDIAKRFFQSCSNILKTENIKFKQKDLFSVVERLYPDFRSIINNLQLNSKSGVLEYDDESIHEENLNLLIEYLKEGNWNAMRKWAADHVVTFDTHILMRKIYDKIVEHGSEHIPSIIVTIAEYQYKAAFVIDKEINLVAMLTEIMAVLSEQD